MLFKEFLATNKEYAKAKSIRLMKAYIMQPGEEMQFPMDGALLFTSPLSAVENYINTESTDIKGKLVTLLCFDFPVAENKERSLGDNEYLNAETGAVGITVSGLIHTIDVEDYKVDDISFTVDEKTEIKKITNLDLTNID